MTKEGTINKINKLILLYEKRVKTCDLQYIELNEMQTSIENKSDEIVNLQNEKVLYEEFIEDLQSIMKDDNV